MCGRYALAIMPIRLTATFALPPETVFPADRYNIAPTQKAPVIRIDANGIRNLAILRWGLVPGWAKDLTVGSKMINARSETVATKPSFRAAYKMRRCLVPTSGFFEWKKMPNGNKQPYFIHSDSDECLVMAGLWEQWRDREHNQAVETFTILTTAANQAMKSLHDRMPVFVSPDDFDRWLDPAMDSSDLLQPDETLALSMHPVSRRVNSTNVDEPSLLAPIDLDTRAVKPDPQRRLFD